MKKVMIAAWVTPSDGYENYIKAVEALGCEAFISLNLEDLDQADGLILPGSPQDMNPKLWGAEDICSHDINDELDRIQWALMDRAIASDKPILGICRGMQFINVYFGGTLIQDLPNADEHKASDPERYHLLFTAEGTALFNLYGMMTETNSRHHQGVGCIGENLKVSAMWIEDGGLVMEAIEHREYPIIGVQWHPERMALYGNEQQRADGEKLIRYWLNLK